jgi:uncharacterized protein YjbI with pentapeptide repeats
MTSEIERKSRVKPENNSWYLLATLYGQPKSGERELQARNRCAWNHYMFQWLNPDDRARLRAPHASVETTPPAAEMLAVLENDFYERHQQAGSAPSTLIPKVKLGDQIDFSNIDFDMPFCVDGFWFPVPADFTSTSFSANAHFEDAIFFGEVGFGAATSSGQIDFNNAIFFDGADFSGVTFSSAYFERATFYGHANFEGAVFSHVGGFWDATFTGLANFEGAIYADAHFDRAAFASLAVFKGATFSRLADFTGATFSGRAIFSAAMFQSAASFVNAEMKETTSFEAATFSSSPPRFFGAKLHEGTVWRRVSWPAPPTDATKAGGFVDAYERLKLEMDRLKKHEDELDFFALELQSRRVLQGDWQPISELQFFGHIIHVPSLEVPKTTIRPKSRKLLGRPFKLPPFTLQPRTITLYRPTFGLAIGVYGVLCDYGRSYIRPLYGLLVTAAAGALPFWFYFGWPSKFWQAIGLSLANTFGVLGFRKDFIKPQVIDALPGILKVFAALQTGAGLVLLFLFGLALRNRFRMR